MDLRVRRTPNPLARSPRPRPPRPVGPPCAAPASREELPTSKVCLPAYPGRLRSLPPGGGFSSGPADRRACRGGKARAPRRPPTARPRAAAALRPPPLPRSQAAVQMAAEVRAGPRRPSSASPRPTRPSPRVLAATGLAREGTKRFRRRRRAPRRTRTGRSLA